MQLTRDITKKEKKKKDQRYSAQEFQVSSRRLVPAFVSLKLEISSVIYPQTDAICH